MSKVSELKPLIQQARIEAERIRNEEKNKQAIDTNEHDLKRAMRHLNASNQSINKIGHGLDKPHHDHVPSNDDNKVTAKKAKIEELNDNLEYIDK